MLSLKGLILFALLAKSIDGGDVTHWFTTTCWSTSWATSEAVTYWNTETQWATAPAQTIYNTVWSTYVQPTTYVSVETETETETETKVITEFVYSTLNNYFTNTETQVYTNTATETQVYTNTATETGTVTQVGTVTATVTKASVLLTTVFATVTEACPTTSLTGLVLCPYRDVNPTYTPPAPLPSDYLWGCAPGTLCTPKQINCNFERDLPADGYICDPNDCVVPPPLPPPNGAWIDYNCTPYVPVEGYANLNPYPFDLDYSIFEFNGQPGHSCPPPPPPPPPTSSYIPPPPPPPPTSSYIPPPPPPPSSTWADWTSPAPAPPARSSWVAWSPAPPPPSSTWADWSSPSPAPPPPPSSTWVDWTAPTLAPPSSAASWQEWGAKSYGGGGWSEGAPHAKVTARAELADRWLVERADLNIPQNCYGPCNQAGHAALSCQKVVSELCPQASPFSSAYDNCGSCILNFKKTAVNAPVVRLVSSLVQFVDFCNSASTSASPPAPLSATTTSPPTVATTSSSPSSPPASPPTSTTAPTSSTTTSTTTSAAASPPSTTTPPTTTNTTSTPVTTNTFTGAAVLSSATNIPIMALLLTVALFINLI